MNSGKYRERLARYDWIAEIRPRILRRAGGMCERCGLRPAVDVHHLHYNTLGREADCDLLAVCRVCHPAEDEKRAREAKRRRIDREDEMLDEARFEGWLRARGYDLPLSPFEDVWVLRQEFDDTFRQ